MDHISGLEIGNVIDPEVCDNRSQFNDCPLDPRLITSLVAKDTSTEMALASVNVRMSRETGIDGKKIRIRKRHN